MNVVIFVVLDAVAFAVIQSDDAKLATSEIQNVVANGGNVYYITTNLTPPAGALYVSKLNSDRSQIVTTAKSAAFTAKHTFFGWGIPA